MTSTRRSPTPKSRRKPVLVRVDPKWIKVIDRYVLELGLNSPSRHQILVEAIEAKAKDIENQRVLARESDETG